MNVDKIRFFCVCAYLLSQAFLIPVAPAGPWPIWPTISDIIFVVLAVVFIFQPESGGRTCSANKVLWKWGILAFVGCAGSYAFGLFAMTDQPGIEAAKAIMPGALQLFRLLQCLVLFNAASATQMTHARLKILKYVSVCLFFGLAAGVMVTYTGIIPTSFSSSHLPADLLLSGPWSFYISGTVDQGVGFVGYNHAYTAIQLLLSAGVALHFVLSHRWLQMLIVSTLLLCTFISGSREGLICALLLSIVLEVRSNAAFAVGGAILAVFMFAYAAHDENLAQAWERQTSSASSLSDDGLSGRTTIWNERLEFLNQQPTRWVTGTGFGSALASGNNAHMLPLHLVVETGLLGLFCFGLLHYKILRAFAFLGPHGKALFWTTTVLLLSSLTQETLYPVLAFPQFEAFFVFCVALGLNTGSACESELGTVGPLSLPIGLVTSQTAAPALC